GDDHARVIAAPIDFYVRAAGEGSAHAHEQITRTDLRNRHPLHLDMFFTVQYCREHCVVYRTHVASSCGLTMIFKGFSPGKSPGCVARRNANSILSRGTR